jgi:DNA invertase Pin-like site-specific DNA recombinase
MMYGYARVSTEDQKLDLQTDALKRAGCQKIVADHGVSGSTTDRPGWRKVIKALKAGDMLVVYSLSRATRSLVDLTALVNDLQERGVEFQSLTEKIDTNTAMGRGMLHILGALSQMERELTLERINAGLAAARTRGVRFGRPSIMSKADHDCALDQNLTVAQAAAKIGVSKRHVYRIRAKAGLDKDLSARAA